MAQALEFLTSGHRSLPASKVTTAEPFAYRRIHLHRQFNQQETQITMIKLKLSFLYSTTLALLVLSAVVPSSVHADGGAVDTMSLTDEPGNWFKSAVTGTPFTAIRAGQRVDFKINNCCTITRHTVTLLMKPAGSRVVLDQDSSQNGTLSATFDVPGV